MAKRKVNKSAKVRDYLKDHPDAGPTEVARALKSYGVTPATVSNTKARMAAGTKARMGAGRRKKRKRAGRPRGTGRNGAMRRTASNVDAVVAAAKLIRQCGGLDEAKAALKTADQIASALS